MINQINNLLIFLQRTLAPYSFVVMFIGILYSLTMAMLYIKKVREKDYDIRGYGKILINISAATFILAYGSLLNYQEPDGFEYLYLLIPSCGCLFPIAIVLVIIMELSFIGLAQKGKN